VPARSLCAYSMTFSTANASPQTAAPGEQPAESAVRHPACAACTARGDEPGTGQEDQRIDAADVGVERLSRLLEQRRVASAVADEGDEKQAEYGQVGRNEDPDALDARKAPGGLPRIQRGQCNSGRGVRQAARGRALLRRAGQVLPLQAAHSAG